MAQPRYSSIPYTDGTELAPLDQTWKAPNATVTAYAPVPDNGYAPTPPTQYAPYAGPDPITEPLKPDHHHLHHWESPKPPFIKTLFVQFFAFLWLVPIAVLLYLNISNKIIGASAWCPFGHCDPQIFGTEVEEDWIKRPAEFDKDSHNLLGSLQLVAKALEVWFILICGWFVYLITAILASRRGGLPVGYLFRSLEYAELAGLVDPLLWTTLRRRKTLTIFVIGTVFLCVLCNLMGPAVAVLVLPSLQWVNIPKVGHLTMSRLNYDNMRDNFGFAWSTITDYCNSDQYGAGNFSCAEDFWGRTTDAMVESYLAATNTYSIFAAQNLLSFSYNKTDWTDTQPLVSWMPSRQIMSNISRDWDTALEGITYGSNLANLDPNGAYTQNVGGPGELDDIFDTFKVMTQTVQTVLQRDGPILGAVVNYWSAFSGQDQWETQVDSSRSIRCYDGWNISNSFRDHGDSGFVGTYTRCITIGDWGDNTNDTQFNVDSLSLKGSISNDKTPGVDFHIYHSSRVAFLPDGNLPSGFPASCLPRNGPITGGSNATLSSGTCDWDTFFSSGQDDPVLRARSRNVTTWEMFWDPEDIAGYPDNITLAVDFTVYQSMATYTFDPSVITNPQSVANFELTNDESAPTLTNPLAIDVAWSLAAFAVDDGGLMDPSRRSVGSRLLVAFNFLWDSVGDQPLADYQVILDGPLMMTVLQLLSLVDHSTALSPGVDKKTQNPQQPLLQVNARIYVWAYGLASRTSYLGVLVAVLGGVVVIMEVVLGLVDRRRFRSPTQYLVAALEHNPNDEFKGIREEKLLSRVPFRLMDDAYSAGRFKFEKVG